MKGNLMNIALVTLLLFTSCDSMDRENKVSDDSIFLLGQWRMVNNGEDEKIFVEVWTAGSDSSYSGRAYIENTFSGDRFNTEQVVLKLVNGEWIYSAEPVGQLPVDFTCTQHKDDLLLFENPEHDFPQYIEYRKIAADSLLVSIGDTSTRNSWTMVRTP